MLAFELIVVLELISGFLRFVQRLFVPFDSVLALIRYQYGYRCISILLSITLGLAPRCFLIDYFEIVSHVFCVTGDNDPCLTQSSSFLDR